MAEIQLKNVSKQFPDGFIAVRNLNLTVEDGKFLLLVGPIGSGKTTILRMIAGLEDITSGDLLINGVSAKNTPPRERGIAMLFHKSALYDDMTVYDNIAFGLRLQELPEEEIDHRVKETAETLKIRELLSRYPEQLSTADRQKTLVGRAIVRKPSILLMDDPIMDLQPSERRHAWIGFMKLCEMLGCTIVYAEDEPKAAGAEGVDIALINNGSLQQRGSTKELYRHPANRFVADFMGSPEIEKFKNDET